MSAPGWMWRGLALSLGIAPLGCVLNRPAPTPSAPFPVTGEPDVPADCALYRGAATGNDANMGLSIALCSAPGGVVGWARFVSAASGWSHREVAGVAAPDGSLALRDTRVVESHPAYGWELCPVDDYRLREVSPGVVEGTYRSLGCMDQAAVVLRRVR